MRKIYFIFCFMLLMLSGKMNSFGQVLAWDFNTITPIIEGNKNSFPSSYNNPDVVSSTIERGIGAGGSTSGYTYAISVRFVEAADSYENAVLNNAYLEFKVKSTTAYISLAGLDVKLIKAAKGATNYRWVYKKAGDVDFTKLGSADADFPIADAQGITQPTLELSTVNALQNIPANTEVTFRLYGWGAVGTASDNNSGIGKTASSEGAPALVLRGLTTATPINLSTNNQIASWQWSASSSSSVAIASPISATAYNSNLNTYELSRGAGLTGVALQRAFVSKLGTASISFNNAEAANEYYQIALKANSGYYTTLSSLLYRVIRAADGPTSYQWRYSIDGGANFVNIGAVSTFSESQTIANGVDMHLNMQGVTALENVPSTTNVILRMYVWGNTSNSAAFGFGRFNNGATTFNSIYIKGTVNNTLPVKLTSFTGKKDLNGVQLNWETATETNNSHFEVYRSATGKPSVLLGSVKGNGTSVSVNNYSYIDYTAPEGINYYQLRQVDKDGNYTESSIIPVNTGLEEMAIKVYLDAVDSPNINILISGVQAGKGELKIIDISGRNVFKQAIILEKGINSFKLPFNYNQGIYVVSVAAEKGERLSAKFVK